MGMTENEKRDFKELLLTILDKTNKNIELKLDNFGEGVKDLLNEVKQQNSEINKIKLSDAVQKQKVEDDITDIKKKIEGIKIHSKNIYALEKEVQALKKDNDNHSITCPQRDRLQRIEDALLDDQKLNDKINKKLRSNFYKTLGVIATILGIIFGIFKFFGISIG